jgi:monooxygenase
MAAPSTILFLQRHANTAGKEPEEAMNAQHFDVLIIGAGLSGIGTACQVSAEHPNKTIAVLERRARLGGTWDLFRYPGIRSD